MNLVSVVPACALGNLCSPLVHHLRLKAPFVYEGVLNILSHPLRSDIGSVLLILDTNVRCS
jgi:hypothetical protein